MYKTQQLIILTGITLIFLMGLYPPWVYIDSNKVEHPMGYSLIWKPPINEQQVKAQLFGITLQLDTKTQTANTIDIVRLLLQVAVLSVVIGGAVVLCKKTTT